MKIKISLLSFGLTLHAFAQLPPIGNSPTPVNNTANNAASAWYRGGNNPVGATPANSNIFGTLFNSPIYTQTDGQNRTKLNGRLSYPVNGGANLARNGFFLLGADNTMPNGGTLYGATRGAYSLLHLNGINPNGFAQEGGFRDWMRYGITSTHNQDLMYIGQRATGGADITDAVIGWADNSGGQFGPDNMVFNYLSGAQGGTNDLNGLGNFGREIMRLSGAGNVGIGPRFNNTFAPQSTLHQHQENSSPSWMQISNQASGGTANATAPTAITANDGLRWGIDNGNKAYIYNQENNPLLFSTNRFVNNAGVGTENERLRISHIGAVGSTNPHGIAQDRTRVSISHDPTAPIINPLSLLHIGYRLDNLGNPVGGTRNWMDVGMLVAQGTDHVWLGLKNEGDPNNVQDFNRRDAVLAWGDDFVSPTGFNTGPDKLRIIFTTPTTNFQFSGPGDMSSQNGLEFVRFVPFHNTVFNRNEPRMGVGNFEQLAIEPQNTLHVNSANNFNAPNGGGQVTGLGAPTGHSGIRLHDLRSIAIPRANPGSGVLSVDSVGDIIYVPKGNSTANNGLSVDVSGNTQLGGDCGNDTLARLTNNRSIPMNGHNINFRGDSAFKDKINIGFPCNLDKPGKVNIFTSNKTSSSINNQTRALNVDNYNSPNQSNIGISVNSVTSPSILGIQYGILSYAEGGREAVGVRGISGGGRLSVGGDFQCNTLGTSSQFATGVRSGVSNGTINNFGVHAIAGGGQLAIGGYFRADNANTGSVAYGIYAEATTNGSTPGVSPTHYAGYFNGDVIVTGNASVGSDQILKENIDSVSNALSIINQLKPKTYTYKHSSFPSMQLAQGLQYGLIAQEVEQILPELVTNNTQPPVFDSVGNVVTPAVNFKGLEYQQLIPILIKAIQEQQKTIDSLSTKQTKQDSINNAVQAQLAALASQLNGCCTNAAAKVNQAPSQTQKTIHQLEVELSDKDAIVLEQNVPNPFAEQTTILYNIPTSVGKAQILFYNSAGQIIKSVDVTNRGNGKLIVFANDLSSGLYHYTLVADGKVVDSKKMVRE